MKNNLTEYIFRKESIIIHSRCRYNKYVRPELSKRPSDTCHRTKNFIKNSIFVSFNYKSYTCTIRSYALLSNPRFQLSNFYWDKMEKEVWAMRMKEKMLLIIKFKKCYTTLYVFSYLNQIEVVYILFLNRFIA